MTRHDNAAETTYVLAADDQALLQTLRSVAAGGVGQRGIVCELAERRSEFAKHFLNADGTVTAVIHGKPLHYRSVDAGPWLDIAPRWERSSEPGFAWRVTGVGYDALIADTLGSSPFMRVRDRGGKTRDFALGRPFRRNIETNEVVYGAALPRDVALTEPDGNTFTLDLHLGRTLRIIADNHRVISDLDASVPAPSWRWHVPILPIELAAAEIFYGETADGYIWGQNSSYSTARSTSYDCNSSDSTMQIGQVKAGIYYVHRGFLSFATGTIEDSANIVGADLYLKASTDNSTNDFSVMIYRYSWSEPLCSSREANYDGAYGGSATLEGTLRNTADGWSSGTYYSMSVGTARINKTGDTKYTIVSSNDVAGTEPTTLEYVLAYTADATGTGSDPYLAITYATPVTINAVPALVRLQSVASVITGGARALAIVALMLLVAIPAAVSGAARVGALPTNLAAILPAPVIVIEELGISIDARGVLAHAMALPPTARGAATAGPPPAPVRYGALRPEVTGRAIVAVRAARASALAPAQTTRGAAKAQPAAAFSWQGAWSATITGKAMAVVPHARLSVQAAAPAISGQATTTATIAVARAFTLEPATRGAAAAMAPACQARAFVTWPDICIGPVIEPPTAIASAWHVTPMVRTATSLAVATARISVMALPQSVMVGCRVHAAPALASGHAHDVTIATGVGIVVPVARALAVGASPAIRASCLTEAAGAGLCCLTRSPVAVLAAARIAGTPAMVLAGIGKPAIEMVPSGVLPPGAFARLHARGYVVIVWYCAELCTCDAAATALLVSDAAGTMAVVSDVAATVVAVNAASCYEV